MYVQLLSGVSKHKARPSKFAAAGNCAANLRARNGAAQRENGFKDGLAKYTVKLNLNRASLNCLVDRKQIDSALICEEVHLGD